MLPKAGVVGRVLDWTNLALSCWRAGVKPEDTSCGTAKNRSDLPQGCDPRAIPLTRPFVDVGLDGRLSVNAAHCTASGIAPSDVQATIGRVLNLDCERLRKSRQDAGDVTRQKVTELLGALVAAKVADEQQKLAFEELVASRLSPDAAGRLLPFWSAERCALGAPSTNWISNNQGLFL